MSEGVSALHAQSHHYCYLRHFDKSAGTRTSIANAVIILMLIIPILLLWFLLFTISIATTIIMALIIPTPIPSIIDITMVIALKEPGVPVASREC